MTQTELKNAMTQLFKELHNPIVENKAVHEKQIIAKAVQLGMDYKESIIKEGINIVFQEINKKQIYE